MSAPGDAPGAAAPGKDDKVPGAQYDGEYGKRDGDIKDFGNKINEGRKCRDVFCCILFLIMLLGLFAVAAISFYWGNPYRIIYPVDTQGNICGFVNGNVSLVSRPNLVFPLTSILALNFSVGICVSSCPGAGDTVTSIYGETYTSAFNTTALFYRCFPTTSPVNITSGWFSNLWASPSYLFNQSFADVYNSWWVLLAGLGVAMVIALFWICFLRFCAGCVIWISLFVMFVALAALDVFFFLTAYGINYSSCVPTSTFNLSSCLTQLSAITSLTSTSTPNSQTMFVFAIVLACIIGILFFVVLCMCERICLAVAIIKEASRAVGAMPLIVFFPFWIFIALSIYIGFWIVVLVFLAGTGTVTIAGFTFDTAANLQYVMIYHLFCLLWGIAFILAIGQATIAGAIGQWYFTVCDPVTGAKDVKGWPIIASLRRTLRYHLGSLAFGSLLIAIVQLIRVILAYMERKLKGAQNAALRCLLRVLQCFFACFERFLAFINRNAYIEIALFGYSFCQAAKTAFQLILRNILRMAAVSGVSDVLMFVGKLLTAAACGVFCYMMLSFFVPAVQLYAVVVVLACIGGFIIASAFFVVYGMAIDTILLCFLEDEERHGAGDTPGKPQYMSKELQGFMHDSKKGCCCCC